MVVLFLCLGDNFEESVNLGSLNLTRHSLVGVKIEGVGFELIAFRAID